MRNDPAVFIMDRNNKSASYINLVQQMHSFHIRKEKDWMDQIVLLCRKIPLLLSIGKGTVALKLNSAFKGLFTRNFQ